MLAKDIMTTDVITITEDMPVKQIAELFVKNNISGAPVVDDTGTLIGIVTESDLVYQEKPLTAPYFINILDAFFQINRKEYQEDFKKITATTAGTLMVKKPFTATADTDISEIAKLIIQHRINRVPIIDEENKVIGMVSRHDIVKSMIDQ